MEADIKRKNFKRIAEARVNKALDMIDLIGNLSNTSFYSYDDREVQAIFDALEKALKTNKQKFQKNQIKDKRRFIL